MSGEIRPFQALWVLVARQPARAWSGSQLRATLHTPLMFGGRTRSAHHPAVAALTLDQPRPQPRLAGGGCRGARLALFNVVGGFLVTDRIAGHVSDAREQLMRELTIELGRRYAA